MVTLPPLAMDTNISRLRTTRPPSVSRCRTRPGTTALTRTPRRTFTLTRPPPSGRVVSKTTTWWSPGSACRGCSARRVSIALAPERSNKRVGTMSSHFAGACPPTVRRVASTATCSAPSFRTLIALAPGTARTSRAGETDSATRGRTASTPSAEGADAKTSAVRHASARTGLTRRGR